MLKERMEEQELAERCRQGDNLARKELYERYAGRMLSVCLRYAGDRETAQDLMHDGFLKLFDSFDKFTWRGEGSLRAWMERVMVNTVLQYLRKNDVMNQSSALENAPEAYEEPEGSSIDVIPQKVLMQFISELPAGYRTVFNLYIFEEKSHKEIARLLGINEKSSASQLTRAKATLAAKVREWMKRNDKMKERMEDELWLKKIKDKLEDYSEPLPVAGWERLEKELSVSGAPITGPHRMIPFRRWAVAAAAVLLVAVSSVSLWLLQSPVGNEMRHTSVPALAVAPDVLPEQTVPAIRTNSIEPAYRAHGNASAPNKEASHPLVAQHIRISVGEEQQEEMLPVETADEVVGIGQQAEEPVVEDTDHETTMQTEEPETREDRYRPSGRDKLHLPEKNSSGRDAKGWAVGLSVGNTGGFSLANEGEANVMSDYMPGSPIYGGNVDLSSTANGIVTIPDGQELVFKDGMPYLQRREKKIADIDHKQPLSFGVSVRKNLAKGFSVESGLTYTYLASDVRYEGSSEKISQKLHYIGIPVRANWNFVDAKNFTMYVSAGGAIEKCVYGKIGTESETVKPVQLSVMGAVGAQYNISNRVGLYVEPGVSYFFDDGSSIQTIRKENPCNFTLQAGIRLTY